MALLIGLLGHPASASEENTSNFSMVGFDLDVTDGAAFAPWLNAISEDCEMLELTEKDLLCKAEKDTGGQTWVGFKVKDNEVEFHTANPAFRGEGRLEFSFNGIVSDPRWEPFEYSLSGEFSALNIPVLIDLADPRLADKFRQTEPNTKIMLDVTGFTFAPQIHESSEEYSKAQKQLDDGVVWAAEHFAPSGLFGNLATAHAMFGGTILKAELKVTSEGTKHWWTLVQIMEGNTVNVVFDDISTDETPKPGDYIAGEFWLSAQVINEG